jgi:dipeptidase D
MNLQIEAESPALEYKENSRLRDLCIKVYEEMYKEKPQIKAVHAIIEGGVFSQKIDGIDLCLIAPNLYDIHSPSERLSISSTQRVWEYLKKVLKEFKNY